MADDHKPAKAMAGMLKRQSVWPPAGGEACPDASTLAAYFERSLAATETAQWESHFSSCARCREQLAALVRSEPVAAAKPVEDRKPAFAWAWNWRWMAPVGAAVVVLAFVVSFKTLYAPIQSPSSGELTARREPANQPTDAVAPQKSAEAATEKSKTAAASPAQNKPTSTDDAKAKIAVDELKTKKDLADKEAARSGQEFRAPNLSAGGGSGGAVGAVASQRMAAPARDEKAAPAMENRVVAQSEASKTQNRANEMDRAQAAQAAAAPAQTAQKQETLVVAAEAAKEPAAVAPAPLPSGKSAMAWEKAAEGKQAAVDSLAAQQPRQNLRAAPEELVISTPRSGVLWRFKGPGLIERTQDGGKSWTVQKNPTQENILVASAPSETVCWAAGSNGVLLRTMDSGENWEKMPSPTKNAIVSLKASDRLVVTVVSSDGRSYETRDAGAHWRPL